MRRQNLSLQLFLSASRRSYIGSNLGQGGSTLLRKNINNPQVTTKLIAMTWSFNQNVYFINVLVNRTKSKLFIKNLRVTLLQQIFNASHVHLMTEINVSKTIKQKIYVASYDLNFSICSNVWIWTTNIMQVSLFWHQQNDTVFYIFHVPCTALSIVYFQTVISVFRIFAIDCTRKQALFIKRFIFAFIKNHHHRAVNQTYKHNGWKWRVIYLE